MRTPTGICLGLAAFLAAGAAQADGVLLSRFDPSDRGSRFFYADSLELGRQDTSDTRPLVSAGATSSYAFQTTTWGSKRQGKRDTLIKDALWVHPGASITIHPGVRFALDIPIAAYQFGEDTNLGGDYYLAPSSPRIGDVRASFEMLILGKSTSSAEGPTVSGGVNVWLPTGSGDNYAGDDFTRFGIHLSARWRYEWLLAAARVGYMYRRDANLGGSQVGPEANANVGLAFVDGRWTVGPELSTATDMDSNFAKRSTPVEVLLGAHADLGGGLRAGGGIGTAIVKGMGASDLRAVLSLEWQGPDVNGQRDRDGDGIPDHTDMCPDVPGGIDGRGCPNAPMMPDRPDRPDRPVDVPAEPTPEIVPPPIVEPSPTPDPTKSETP